MYNTYVKYIIFKENKKMALVTTKDMFKKAYDGGTLSVLSTSTTWK